ncbi:MAG: hypothetical protein H6739_31680 [Alphaproteobacteria bacterium]|nr:hypothetical protein [Alphaproteobacteria bacterium]
MEHLRAALVLAVIVVTWILGTPGLDFLRPSDADTPEEREAFRELVGEPAATAGLAIMDFNTNIRLPVDQRLAWTQRPFRVSQLWSLYRDGPPRVRRLEIRVDGDLKYRSVDPEHDWLADTLRNRRLRPVAESTVIQYDAHNWEGLLRLVVLRARETWPDAQVVELAATEGPFPGDRMATKYTMTAQAPDWAPAHAWDPRWPHRRKP